MRADYFGRSAYAMVTGMSSMVLMFGSITGPLLAGILADRTGSYETAFTILAVLAALGSVLFALATKPTPPPRRQREPGVAGGGIATPEAVG
jgi:MFS family permease